MHKSIFLFSLLLIFTLSGCSSNEPSANSAKINTSPLSLVQQDKQPKEFIKSAIKVGHIEFEAIMVTDENFNDLNTEFDLELDKSSVNLSTQIVLNMNNHRTDLSTFDYKEISTLDGESAENWEQFISKMGGHHAGGVLTFAKKENPQKLIIKGLPVDEVVLNLKK